MRVDIAVLSGGVGGSRFVQGLLDAINPSDSVTVIANTADDLWLFGLRVCPDLDTLMYTLSGGIDVERGWGRRDETWHAKEELQAYGADRAWFGLGDRDIATHLLRTEILRNGAPLSEATQTLCRRWQPPARLMPMTDDEVETHIATTVDGTDTVIHFQEFWIKHAASVPVRGVEVRGVEVASAAPGVVDAILRADVVLMPPSNPIVSVGPIVAVQQIGEAIRSTPAPVVGVSPIIGGSAVRGMANQLMTGLGLEVSASSVAHHLGSRQRGGILDGWLIDESDSEELAAVESAGVAGRARPLMMSDANATRQLAADALELAAELRVQ